MMTITKLTSAISEKLKAVAEEILNDIDQSEISGNFELVICPERIFVDDYLPKEEEYVNRNADLPEFDQVGANDSPYKDKVFVVLKFGNGQRNYAVSETDLTIQVLSEENDFIFARELLDRFIGRWNYEYDEENGFVMSFFNPSMNSSQDEVYTGFRALMSARGFLRIPENGIMFVSSIEYYDATNHVSFKVPFINLSFNYTTQPDPQSFAGYGGATKALNRQSTTVVSFNTYLSLVADSEIADSASWVVFSNNVIKAMNGEMNAKFKLTFNTPYKEKINPNGGDDPSNMRNIPIMDRWFVLVGVSYNQELGDMSTVGLSFTEAKEVEE